MPDPNLPCLHLIKLCVGADSVADVMAWRGRTLVERKKKGLSAKMSHTTRMWPRRAEELLKGGSLYWVVKGLIRIRQPIAGFEEWYNEDGVRYCTILLEPDMVLTQPTPKRPFQGWRYLRPQDAPADLLAGTGGDETMAEELASLGLL